MSNTKKIKAGLVLQDPSEFVGHAGTLFYNPDTGTMYLSDGVTPGGISLGQGGGGGGFSGNYNDLTNKPNLLAYANTTYVDNKSTWANITGKPSFATVATTGNYNDLTNKPTIPSISGLATETYVTTQLSSKVDSTSLALVATSGNYNDLEYLPTISTVGQTGNYEDLHNKPSIPSVAGLATESYVTSRGYITSAALSSYATQSWVEDKGYVTSSSLSSYATQSWVNDKGYVDSLALNSALSPYALSTDIPTDIANLLDSTGLLGQGSGNPFDQDLNTSNNVTFNEITITADIKSTVATEFYTVAESAGSIDIYTDWSGNGVEVWLKHNDRVEINTQNGLFNWAFDNTGNLTLPQADMNSSPAPTLSGIVFSDGTFQTTAYTGQGGTGADGLSAYQVAVNNGFSGDETAWLASLVGAAGQDGAAGRDGIDGINGQDGAPGQNGQGVPTGGTTGQVLAKIDGSDFNTTWVDVGSSGGTTSLSGLSDTNIIDPAQDQVLTYDGSAWVNSTIQTGNPFDQDLNQTDNVTFNAIDINTITHSGSMEIYSLSGSGGSVDLYTNGWDGAGVEVYLQHNDKVLVSTDNGAYNWAFTNTGELQHPNSVKEISPSYVTCQPNMDTVIYTGSSDTQATFKILLKVEGPEIQGDFWDTQSCEMMVAKSVKDNKVAGSVYGLVYTSINPLATFTTRWNSNLNRVEVLCRPNSTTDMVSVRSFVTEVDSTAY